MSDGEMLTHTKIASILVLMDCTMCMPQTCWTTVVPTARSKTSLFADKAKRRKGSEPFKPLWTLWDERNFSFLRTDHDIGARRAVFDERRQHQKACSQLCWVKGSWPILRSWHVRSQLLVS